MKHISLILLFFFFNTNILAIEKKKIDDPEERYKKLVTLNWKNLDSIEHSKKIKDTNANVLIIESEIYLDNSQEIDQYHWWSYGYTDSDTIFLIKGDEYTIYLSYSDDGYVKLDEWESINPKDLLKQLRETASINAKYLKKNNLEYVTKIDWIFKPTLNKENKSVSYSYKVFWSTGRETMESKNLILGKKGYLESAYVVSYNKELDFNYHSEFSKDFVNGVGFNDGFKYSDYKSGDKVAVAGIGGLVAGSLGVKALAKTGLLVKLAKFWWILLAPLAFLGKFLSGKENSNNSTKDTSTLVRKRKRKK